MVSRIRPSFDCGRGYSRKVPVAVVVAGAAGRRAGRSPRRGGNCEPRWLGHLTGVVLPRSRRLLSVAHAAVTLCWFDHAGRYHSGLHVHATSVALRRAENHLQIALHGLFGQFSDHMGNDHTAAVEKECLWHACDAVVYGGGAGIVYDVEVGDPIGAQEVQSLTVIILEIDAEKGDPLALYALPRCLQKGSLMLTGDAPRCPKVEHHRFSLQARQVY